MGISNSMKAYDIKEAKPHWQLLCNAKNPSSQFPRENHRSKTKTTERLEKEQIWNIKGKGHLFGKIPL